MRAYGTGQAAMQRGTICESPLETRAEGFHLAPALSRPVPGLVAAGKTRLHEFYLREKPVYSKMRLGSVGCGSQGYCKVPTAGLACSSGHPGG